MSCITLSVKSAYPNVGTPRIKQNVPLGVHNRDHNGYRSFVSVEAFEKMIVDTHAFDPDSREWGVDNDELSSDVSTMDLLVEAFYGPQHLDIPTGGSHEVDDDTSAGIGGSDGGSDAVE